MGFRPITFIIIIFIFTTNIAIFTTFKIATITAFISIPIGLRLIKFRNVIFFLNIIKAYIFHDLRDKIRPGIIDGTIF